MREQICSVCGKTASVGNLCDEHYTSRFELFDVEAVEIQVCDNCGTVADRMLKDVGLENAIRPAIERAVNSHGKIERIDIVLKKVGEDYVVTVTAHGTMPPATLPKTETKQTKVRVKRVKCQNCIKLLGRYHEAVVQIRGDRAEYLLEIAGKVVGSAPKRVERLKYGWNLYFVHKAAARAAAQGVVATIKRNREKEIDIIRSYKLVGKKDGKELWRDFYVLR